MRGPYTDPYFSAANKDITQLVVGIIRVQLVIVSAIVQVHGAIVADCYALFVGIAIIAFLE